MELIASEWLPASVARNVRRAPRPGGAHDRACREAVLIPQPQTEPSAVALYGFHFGTSLNRKPIASLVTRQIVDHLVGGRKAFRLAWRHWPARERAIGRGREQAKRVPGMKPGATGAIFRKIGRASCRERVCKYV